MTTNPRSLAFDEKNHRLICEIHIGWTDFDDLYVDTTGQKWDICKDCAKKEKRMPMPIEAKEITVGDWSPNYGTVTVIRENKNFAGDILGYDITFFNGQKLTNVAPDYQLVIVQGGSDLIHEGMPDKSQIRPGLKADHAKD